MHVCVRVHACMELDFVHVPRLHNMFLLLSMCTAASFRLPPVCFYFHGLLACPSQDIRAKQEWQASSPGFSSTPQASLPMYNPLMMARLRWLAEAAEMNAFGTEAFMWIDGMFTVFARVFCFAIKVISCKFTDHCVDYRIPTITTPSTLK